MLGQIADRLLDLGDIDRARAVLARAALAGSLGKGNKGTEHCPPVLAEALARLDLPAALKIIEDLEQDARKNEKGDRSLIFERYFGLIATSWRTDRRPTPRSSWSACGIRPNRRSRDRRGLLQDGRRGPGRARRIAETRISPMPRPSGRMPWA